MYCVPNKRYLTFLVPVPVPVPVPLHQIYFYLHPFHELSPSPPTKPSRLPPFSKHCEQFAGLLSTLSITFLFVSFTLNRSNDINVGVKFWCPTKFSNVCRVKWTGRRRTQFQKCRSVLHRHFPQCKTQTIVTLVVQINSEQN